VEAITFECPACKQQLQFDAQSCGLLFRCPTCGTAGTLPEPLQPEPVPDEGELETRAYRRARKIRRKAWRRVRRGMLLILVSWGVVTFFATLLLLALLIQFLAIFFDVEPAGAGPGPAVFGTLGLILFVTEFAAIVGYTFCLAAPADAGVRGWVWGALAIAYLRNILFLISSILFFAAGPQLGRALAVCTILAALAFVAEWGAGALVARAVAHAQYAAWQIRNIWNGIFLAAGTLLGWLVLGLVVFAVSRSVATAAQDGRGMGVLTGEVFLARVSLGCIGAILCALLWASVAWHLRSLFRVWGLIER
jgi:hypothetical protein